MGQDEQPKWANAIAILLLFILSAAIMVPLCVWVGRAMWRLALG